MRNKALFVVVSLFLTFGIAVSSVAREGESMEQRRARLMRKYLHKQIEADKGADIQSIIQDQESKLLNESERFKSNKRDLAFANQGAMINTYRPPVRNKKERKSWLYPDGVESKDLSVKPDQKKDPFSTDLPSPFKQSPLLDASQQESWGMKNSEESTKGLQVKDQRQQSLFSSRALRISRYSATKDKRSIDEKPTYKSSFSRSSAYRSGQQIENKNMADPKPSAYSKSYNNSSYNNSSYHNSSYNNSTYKQNMSKQTKPYNQTRYQPSSSYSSYSSSGRTTKRAQSTYNNNTQRAGSTAEQSGNHYNKAKNRKSLFRSTFESEDLDKMLNNQ